jgi:hypothetical protein
MDAPSESPAPSGNAAVPRWVQVPLGVVLTALLLPSLAGSLLLVVQPNERAPLAAPATGLVMSLACAWLLPKCLRLVTGRHAREGLFGPRSLNAMAWVFLVLPLGGLFTGYFAARPLQAGLQTLGHIGLFVALRRMASHRARVARAAGVSAGPA